MQNRWPHQLIFLKILCNKIVFFYILYNQTQKYTDSQMFTNASSLLYDKIVFNNDNDNHKYRNPM